MQHGMGYPMTDTTGLPQGLTGARNMAPMLQGYDKPYTYNPAVVPVPESAPDLNKVDALSKHIKSLRKQVKKLQDTVNHNMRSDSDNSTLSGNVSNDHSGNSSNDDLVPSKTSSNDTDNTRDNGQNTPNRFRKQQAYPHADEKLVGA
jgi:hypothetical protein